MPRVAHPAADSPSFWPVLLPAISWKTQSLAGSQWEASRARDPPPCSIPHGPVPAQSHAREAQGREGSSGAGHIRMVQGEKRQRGEASRGGAG